MPKLIIQHDQLSATGREASTFESGVSITDMVTDKFPNGIDPESTSIFIGLKEVDLNPANNELYKPLNKETVTIVQEAKGLDPFTIALIVISIVSAAVAIILTPKVPGNVGQSKQSPNNTLQAQTNIARPYQAFPLVLGSPVIYPDLTGEALVEYFGNVKVVKQLMCIGVGQFDIESIRAGGTPIGNFPDAAYTVYEPVAKETIIPSVTYAFATNEIDGQVITGAKGDAIASYSLNESGSFLTTYVGTTFTFQVLADTDSNLLKVDYDAAVSTFTLKVNYLADESGDGTWIDVVGTGSVTSMVLDGGGLFYTITMPNFNGPHDAFDQYRYDVPFITENVSSTGVGPVRISQSMETILFNFVFNRGLKSTVQIRIDMQQLDGPNGNPVLGPQQSFFVAYTENTLEAQYKSFRGTLLSEGYYEFTIFREDNETASAEQPDDTVLEAVYALNSDSNVNYGNLSFIDVEMPATTSATSLRENQINLDATSKLITYVNGAVDYTPISSRKMADCLLYLYVEFFGLSPDTLDLDELYEIQNRLDAIDTRLATFDFTFDDIDVSLDERMDAILQVARCYKWLDGDVYRFGRDDVREFEATLITRRDIVNEGDRDYSLSYNPQLLETFDSVKVEYIDKTINKKAYIFRKLDGAGNVIDGVGLNPKSMELSGCREEYNAINRAELEMRKLIYQRFSLTDTLLPSGMLLDRGDMVLYAEQYNGGNVFDGEILAVTGDIATTSESIIFEDGVDFSVHYTLDDGSQAGPFAITEVTDKPFQFQCASLQNAYVRDSILGFSIQTGSRYIISSTVELEAGRWSVTEKEVQGSNVQVSMINYDNRIYDFD
tara:strand:- start:9140 stop:11644 length:2505 start_codon:yes stop_codon:yes gene_type:complete